MFTSIEVYIGLGLVFVYVGSRILHETGRLKVTETNRRVLFIFNGYYKFRDIYTIMRNKTTYINVHLY